MLTFLPLRVAQNGDSALILPLIRAAVYLVYTFDFSTSARLIRRAIAHSYQGGPCSACLIWWATPPPIMVTRHATIVVDAVCPRPRCMFSRMCDCNRGICMHAADYLLLRKSDRE